MYQSNAEDISKSQSLRSSHLKSHQTHYKHSKRGQEQPVYLSQSDGLPPSPDSMSEGKHSSNGSSTHVYKMKKQALLDSLSVEESSHKRKELKNYQLYDRHSVPSSNVYSQKTTRNQDSQAYQYGNNIVCIEQQIQNMEQENDALQNLVQSLRETVEDLNQTINEKDQQIDKVYYLYDQEQEISSKQKIKITKLNKEMSDLIGSLQQVEGTNTQLSDDNDSIKKKMDFSVKTIHDEYGRKLGQLQHSHDILQDLSVRKQTEQYQLNLLIQQRDQQVKELSDKVKTYETSLPKIELFRHINDVKTLTILSPREDAITTPIFKSQSNGQATQLASPKDDSQQGEYTQRNEQKKLSRMITEKNNTIQELNEQISIMQETQFKLMKSQTEGSADSRKQKELYNQLKEDNNKLCQQIILQQNVVKALNQENEENKILNVEVKDKLGRALQRIEELEKHNSAPQIADQWGGSQMNASSPYFINNESTKPYNSAARKSMSINSTISSMTTDKRQAMDRFNKVTSYGATMGMMNTIMDYQSLNKSSKQAEKQLLNATMDLSQKLKQSPSIQDYLSDRH